MNPSSAQTSDIQNYENDRLQALYSYKILDTPRESIFDEITTSIASALEVPYSKIAFIDSDRIWCKSTVGFVPSDAPIAGSLANLALHDPTQVIEIKNFPKDSRVSYPSRILSNSMIQSAVAFPIVSVDGHVLGVVAAFDTKPREFSDADTLLIQNCARQIAEILEDKRDADFLLDTLIEQREELRSKTISNRIARTLIGSVGTKAELISVINKFVEATVQEFGWWAGQAWCENNQELNPGEWIFSSSVPASLLSLNKHRDTSVANLNSTRQTFTPYGSLIHTELNTSDLGWHPNIKQLESVGARSFIELTVNSCSTHALKIIFVLPHPRALSPSLHKVLENLVILLPQVMKRAKDAQNLIYRATHDSLTGLLNRRGLEECYPDELVDSTSNYSRSVLFFDVDYFKEVNDTYGHSVGDEILVEISKRLMASSRPVDTLARVGGDEFVLVTPGFESSQTLISTANRLLGSINRPVLTAQGHEVQVKVSIGISIMGSHHTLDNALKRADTLMYQAKENGGNSFVLENTSTSTIVDSKNSAPPESCGLEIYKVLNSQKSIVSELYVSLSLPNYFAPLTMSNIADQIDKSAQVYSKKAKLGLIINAPILGRINRSNLEALFDLLVNVHKFSQLSYCVDTQSRGTQILNFAQELNSQGLVKIALTNCGAGVNELQLIQDLAPSHFMISHKLLSDRFLKNKIIIEVMIVIARQTKIPLLVHHEAQDDYKTMLLRHDEVKIILKE